MRDMRQDTVSKSEWQGEKMERTWVLNDIFQLLMYVILDHLYFGNSYCEKE